MRDRGHSRTKVPGQNYQHRSQRNGRGAGSQEAGEKDDRSLDGKGKAMADSEAGARPFGRFGSPKVTCLGPALLALRHLGIQPCSPSNALRPPRPSLHHCTAPARTSLSAAAVWSWNVEVWQCKYDYCTFVVAIICLTRGFTFAIIISLRRSPK